MSVQTQQIHRRKSSKDEEEIRMNPAVEVRVPEENELPSVTLSAPPTRTRTHSTPHHLGHGRTPSLTPASAGPFRTSFAPRGLASPLRSTFSAPMPPQMNGHSRARSISTPFSPVSPSPLSTSFPIHNSAFSPTTTSHPPNMSTSQSAPDPLQQAEGQPAHSKHNRRHSRMHSRNLSVFFPRPGSLQPSTISEDGAQEVEMVEEAPLIPSAGSSVSMPGSGSRTRNGARAPITPLGQGFTFGAKPPSSYPMPELMTAPRSTSSTTSKRGHHHKHSLSHNFFSFLEPGAGGPSVHEGDLHTQPTPIPVSPWGPISAIPPDSAASVHSGFNIPVKHPNPEQFVEPEKISPAALTVSITQFMLGAYLWVTGQQVGSLSCTGLGYWVVFDSFGVALKDVVPGWLTSSSTGGSVAKEREKIRRPYGKGRVETVLMFAQAVYLMFSSVYVCKESVEHLLLSAGGGEGHHHHRGDEEVALVGIDFPIIMTFITFLSLFGTALIFENHTNIVNITGNRIPSFSSIVRSVWSPSRHVHEHEPTTTLALILSNPFVASPLFFCLSILFVALFMPAVQHRVADLVLASIIAGLTFKVAYRASVVLGTVLLQTSPPRGLASGKMEAFLRAMREVERHPQVLHLPAPHIWQLTPSLASSSPSPHQGSALASSPKTRVPSESLVITLELHVREDLADDDVLTLTRWAWERCVSALWNLKDFREMGEEGGPEVTVGVVRG
ncbi:hypothetical protein M413DRAFT_449239 [Hebeloma cylindrosporum]|uniref:Cation efflux protein transmembrane domain-containing protein n=1 Tax=Hebeloma cylindrosporum TaxID=76867 RepID=A0A0C2XEL3_HEBCY|nr:hypothetical protein M413DRAFT_449239 [Hebeloma cylindrosporum h7]